MNPSGRSPQPSPQCGRSRLSSCLSVSRSSREHLRWGQVPPTMSPDSVCWAVARGAPVGPLAPAQLSLVVPWASAHRPPSVLAQMPRWWPAGSPTLTWLSAGSPTPARQSAIPLPAVAAPSPAVSSPPSSPSPVSPSTSSSLPLVPPTSSSSPPLLVPPSISYNGLFIFAFCYD